jgi:hypothetical protein
MSGNQVISELAEPSAIAGESWPTGTGVVIDLGTGAATPHRT